MPLSVHVSLWGQKSSCSSVGIIVTIYLFTLTLHLASFRLFTVTLCPDLLYHFSHVIASKKGNSIFYTPLTCINNLHRLTGQQLLNFHEQVHEGTKLSWWIQLFGNIVPIQCEHSLTYLAGNHLSHPPEHQCLQAVKHQSDVAIRNDIVMVRGMSVKRKKHWTYMYRGMYTLCTL